jgi:diguanylate cyclase (GGDEF)-like protein
MKPKIVGRNKRTIGLLTVGVIICIGFAATCWVVVAEMARRDRSAAVLAATNVIATISADIARNIELYDLSLQAVQEGLNVPNFYLIPPAMRQMILFDRSATARDLGGILALDRDGNVIADSRTEQHNSRVYADRPYFVFHRDNPTFTTRVSPPEINTRAEHVIRVSRRMTDANGQFSGVVVGTLRLSYFNHLLKQVQLGDDDALTIVHTSGRIVMRAPFDIATIGRDIKQSNILQRISAEGAGSFEATAGIDGIKRLYVFQQVEGNPLSISYGASLNGIYANWKTLALQIFILVLALCAMNMAMVIFLARSLERRAAAELALYKLATIDGLTGLANRRTFDQTLAKEWARAQRDCSALALLMIDADQFKSYNDSFGHQAGDTALKAISECIANVTRRGSDFSARYGGEEFVVLLPGASVSEALQIGETLRLAIVGLREDQQGRLDSTPTVSVGIASMKPRVGLETKDLLKASDNALYQAKAQGRNCCVSSIHQQPTEVFRDAA